MKNINLETLEQDEGIITELLRKYNNAVWENQEGQRAHFDNQPKIVQMCMRDVTVGLTVAMEAVKKLIEMGVIEDESRNY